MWSRSVLRWGVVILSEDIFRLIPNRGKDPQGDLGTKGRDYTWSLYKAGGEGGWGCFLYTREEIPEMSELPSPEVNDTNVFINSM